MVQHPVPPAATQPEPATPAACTRTRGSVMASYLLMAAVLLLVMWRGLLPGLLCVCLGFLLPRALPRWSVQARGRVQRQPPSPPGLRAAPMIAAGLVMLLPLGLLAAGLTHSRGYIVNAPQQYPELRHHKTPTALQPPPK